MPRLLLALALVTVAVAVALVPAPVAAGDGSWAWPVAGVGGGSPVVQREFEAPETKYGPGHRGVDISALVGTPVRAVAGGVVTFAGVVAGVAVATVDHGAERSTYQPVSATVSVGDEVEAGSVIGKVVLGPFHCSMPCLHLGRVAEAGDRYLDPLDRLAGHSPIRLVDPDGPPPVPPVGSRGSGLLLRPVAGPVTSPFGTREHPTTGKPSLHEGADFGAPCGAPAQAAAAGTVVAVGRSGAYGLNVVVRHDDAVETLYGHLSDALVEVGDDIARSATVGRVGSTGLSTGCHLHFGVRQKGRYVDPITLL